MDEQRPPRWHRWVLLAVLLVASVAPAEYARRIIVDYAAVAEIPVTVERNFVFRDAGNPARDGQGLAVGSDGTIFLAELSGGRVIAFSGESANAGRVFAPHPGEPSLTRPQGLAVAADGTVFVLERGTGVVTAYDATGGVRWRAELASPGAEAIAVNEDGELFVADSSQGVVRKLSSRGEVQVAWGDGSRPGTTRLGSVVGLAAGWDGLFATSQTDNAVVCVDDTGSVRARRPARGEVGMLAIGDDARLYMTDKRFNRVWVFDRDCREIGRLVGKQEGLLFMQPRGIAVPGDGLVYVVNGARVTTYRLPPGGSRIGG